MKDIRVVELFAGVGGFRVGLEKASEKFKTVFANQWEPSKKVQHAYECYVNNFGSENAVCKDITVAKHNIPEHDLLVGGFPCQDYSVAQVKANGIEGKKGVLWWEIRDIVEKKKPKYILLENVDRLIKSPANQRGRDFAIMLKTMEDLGYNIEWRVINSAEYGFSQRRRRVFIFGWKKSNKAIKIKNPNKYYIEGFFGSIFPVDSVKIDNKKERFEIIDSYKEIPLIEVSDNVSQKFWNSGIMINGKIYSADVKSIEQRPITLKQIIEKKNVDSKYFLSEKQIEDFRNLRSAKRKEKNKDGFKYTWSEGAMEFPDSLNKPGRTMLTSEGSVNRSTHVIEDIKTGKLRFITEIEAERLNGFSDNWTKTIPQRMRYFTMGNALVVGLIEKMGTKIIELEKK